MLRQPPPSFLAPYPAIRALKNLFMCWDFRSYNQTSYPCNFHNLGCELPVQNRKICVELIEWKSCNLDTNKIQVFQHMKYVFKHIGLREPAFYTMFENDILYSIPIDLFVKFGEKLYNVQNPLSTWYKSLSKEEKRYVKLEALNDNWSRFLSLL